MAEMIDIFDGNHRLIGSFERKAAHVQGLWHQTFHCWITWKDTVILQLRAPTKANYPNMLDISAAGHLEAGETPLDGVREIEEELGIRVAPERLRYLGIKHDVMDEANGVRNREFAHVYLLESADDMHSMRLAPDEVSGLVQIRIVDMLALFSGKVDSVQVDFRTVASTQEEAGKRSISRDDLIPRVDNYYYKVAILADLASRDYAHLSI